LVAAAATATVLAAPSGRGDAKACVGGRGSGGQESDQRESGEGDRMQPPRPQGPPPLDRILEHHAEELGIDDATLDRIRAIADDVREDMDGKHDAVRAAHEALRSLAETPDAPQ